MNTLIAYYTWSGNTGKLAELIGRETGGTLFEILPKAPYSQSYDACTEQAKKEIAAGFLPELLRMPEYLDGYDAIFVGTPNWWSTLAPPVSTFLTGVDLSGRTVLPFCTHGGGGLARCGADAAKLCPDSNVLDGLAVYGGSGNQKDVSRWLSAIGLKK